MKIPNHFNPSSKEFNDSIFRSHEVVSQYDLTILTSIIAGTLTFPLLGFASVPTFQWMIEEFIFKTHKKSDNSKDLDIKIDKVDKAAAGPLTIINNKITSGDASEQQVLIAKAKKEAQANPGETAKNIANFGITDQEALIEIAKLCAEKDPLQTASNIQKFGINDQKALIEIAKQICASDSIVIILHIAHFGINDQKALIEIANFCARKNPTGTAIDIHRFGINDQKALIEIAKQICASDSIVIILHIAHFGINDQKALIEIAHFCARKNPTETAIDIHRFGINDQNALIEIANFCAEKNPGLIPINIHKFGITDQEALIEIANFCAEKNPGLIPINIHKFGITDQEALIEIAKLCAEKDPLETARNIHNFGINDQKALIEIAKLCAEKNPGQTAINIHKFGINDQKALIEIAKQICVNDSTVIIVHIANFGITDQKALIEIANLCAKKNPGQTAINIHKFGINDEKALIEIAKLICVGDSIVIIIYNIANFGITDQKALIEIAKLCAQQYARLTAEKIKNFGITDQKVRIEIAKFCAQRPSFFAQYINNFEITDQKALIELANLSAENDSLALAANIYKFAITDQNTLIEIAKLCAQKNGYGTARYIKNFGITDQKARIEIAMICAKQNCLATAEFIENFGIGDIQEVVKIFLYLLNQDPDCFRYFYELSNREVEGVSDFFDLFDSKTFEIGSAISLLKNYLNQHYKGLGFEVLFKELEGIKNDYAKQQMLYQIGQLFLILRLSCTDQELAWIKGQGFLEAFSSLKIPTMRFILILALASAKLPVHSQYEAIPKTKYEKYPFGKYLRLLSAQLIVSGVEKTELDQLIKRLDTIFKIFKDDKKFATLIHTLYLLRHNQILDTKEQGKILQKIYTSGDKETFRNNLESLYCLLTLGYESRLRNSTDSFIKLFQIVFNEIVPIGNIENASAKLINTFGTCRNPQALYRYAAGLKKLDDKSVMVCLAEFVKGVLEGTFVSDRNSHNNNPHLKHLSQVAPDLLSKWQISQSFPLEELVANKDPTHKSFFYLDWLNLKLITDQHIDLNLFPYLKTFLETNEKEKKLEILHALETHEQLIKKEDLQFQHQCISLWVNWNEETKRRDILKKMQHLLSIPAFKNPEFANDIVGLLEGQTQSDNSKKELVVESEDPFDLLLCGTDVSSCQRIDGGAELNKGLLGYIMDGKNRLIAVKNPQGKILSRSILRILWDGKKVVLFLERLYPNPTSKTHEQAIRNLAKKKADMLGVPLVEHHGKGTKYGSTLQSFGGPAPFEYVDAAEGIQAQGKYTIENCTLA